MKNPNQKLKILYLMKILLEQTDDNHLLSMAQILERLRAFDIVAERKSIYDDIEALRLYGLDVEMVPGRSGGYYVASRVFQLPELKLLVDSVQACKFISAGKTRILINKLESLTSIHQARSLHRQVIVTDRIKTMNESVYYNVDRIYNGINENRQISFRYYDYTIGKTRKYRRSGQAYSVSPLALIWEDEKYYLVGYDNQAGHIKHYRVDKMDSILLLEQEREGLELFSDRELPRYSRKFFSMYGGEECNVCLRFSNELVGVALDRFGKELILLPDGEEHFRIRVDLQLSPQFYGWIFSLGDGVEVLSPPQAVESFREMARAAAER